MHIKMHSNLNTLLLCSDKEIQFFELVNFEPYCQLCQLDTTPLKMDFWCNNSSLKNYLYYVNTHRSNPRDCQNCVLVYGDNVVSYIMAINNNFLSTRGTFCIGMC